MAAGVSGGAGSPGVCTYACAMNGDDVVAVGRVVADGGWAGVFGVATLPQGEPL